MKIIKILGTEYTISEQSSKENKKLSNADGYCDKTTKEIVIIKLTDKNSNLGNTEEYREKLLRHEIVHAFLFESGLHENAEYEAINSVHPEQIVDWIAIQFPKILMAFKKVGAM